MKRVLEVYTTKDEGEIDILKTWLYRAGGKALLLLIIKFKIYTKKNIDCKLTSFSYIVLKS